MVTICSLHPALTVNNAAFCIYEFHVIFTVNNDYFLKQR
jgi:hypothetical protein